MRLCHRDSLPESRVCRVRRDSRLGSKVRPVFAFHNSVNDKKTIEEFEDFGVQFMTKW